MPHSQYQARPWDAPRLLRPLFPTHRLQPPMPWARGLARLLCRDACAPARGLALPPLRTSILGALIPSCWGRGGWAAAPRRCGLGYGFLSHCPRFPSGTGDDQDRASPLGSGRRARVWAALLQACWPAWPSPYYCLTFWWLLSHILDRQGWPLPGALRPFQALEAPAPLSLWPLLTFTASGNMPSSVLCHRSLS